MTSAVILASAPNGAYKTKKDHAALPIDNDELIQFALAAQKAGSNMLHLHIRDKHEKHSLDANQYLELLKAIKQKLEQPMVLQVTSESAKLFDVDTQINMIKSVVPEFVSIALREITRASKEDVHSLFRWMKLNHVNSQIILYDEKDAQSYLAYLKEGLLEGKQFPLLFVAGRDAVLLEDGLSSIQSMKAITQHHVKSWMTCGFEQLEFETVKFSLQQGGHIRVGFENNLHDLNGKLADNNETQLLAMVKMLDNDQHHLASYEEAVDLLTPVW